MLQQGEAITVAPSSMPPGGATITAPRKLRVTLRRIARGTWQGIFDDNISLLAAGVAFYALLAIFPALAFLVTMYGLLSDPAEVQRQLVNLKGVLPDEAWSAVNTQLLALTRQTNTSLSIASLLSLGLALLNARLAASAMMGALNFVYNRDETRNFFVVNAIAFGFTLAAIAMIAINIAAVVAVPQVLDTLGFPETSHNIVKVMRWPVLAILMAAGLALTYRYGPDQRQGHWRWLTLGSLVATALWLIGSSAFSWYVEAFNSYDRLYGSFGAVVILLYWLWLTALAALMGAEIDMQIHTATTTDA